MLCCYSEGFTKSFYAQVTFSKKHSLEGVGVAIISIAVCLGLLWNYGFKKLMNLCFIMTSNKYLDMISE